MNKIAKAAAAGVFVLSVSVLAYLSVTKDKSGLGIKQMLWCSEYFDSVRSESDRLRLASWVDAEIFSREFANDDFRFGHFAGPRKASHTLNTNDGNLRLPGWMPAHYEIRVLGKTGSEFNSVFITGGRYRGLVVVRENWDEAFDGKYLKPKMITVRSGRVGLVCYVD